MRKPKMTEVLDAIDRFATAQHQFLSEQDKECDANVCVLDRTYRRYHGARVKLQGMLNRLYGVAPATPEADDA